MRFNSLEFFIFLAVTVPLYYILPLNGRKIFLLLGSFCFYMAWNPKYIFLMLSVIFITYISAILICRKPEKKHRVLYISLALNLGLLFYFKYFNFCIDTINYVFKAEIPLWNIVLPVGISFYIFQAIGYVIDVFRDEKQLETNFINYALFISFFPQLVAGPIERSGNMLGQFKTKQAFDIENIKNGITLVLIGLVEKVVIADRLAVFVNGVFSNYTQADSFTLVTAVIFFAFQVYCDFNAYSLIAIGSAKMLGYKLMFNFNRPYLSKSFSEYWSRWHISLSTWFQDYIFTPFVWANPLKKFGYNKPPMLAGLVLVFLVSGFWHGAAWTYVVWGLLHALFRVVEAVSAKKKKKFFKKHKGLRNNKLFIALQVFITFTLNGITYIFFRATSVTQAFDYLKLIFLNANPEILDIASFGLSKGDIILSFGLIIILMLIEIVSESKNKDEQLDLRIDKKPVWLQSIIYAGLFLLLISCGMYGTNYVENPFIYFQF